jgi:hypothetical protein
MLKIFWLENQNVRDHSEDLDADGMIKIGWILGKQFGKV